jgi:hypothetical protein
MSSKKWEKAGLEVVEVGMEMREGFVGSALRAEPAGSAGRIVR